MTITTMTRENQLRHKADRLDYRLIPPGPDPDAFDYGEDYDTDEPDEPGEDTYSLELRPEKQRRISGPKPIGFANLANLDEVEATLNKIEREATAARTDEYARHSAG